MSMQGYSVNCSMLFQELPIWDRPAAARDAGFTAIEFWWPFAEPVPPSNDVDRFVECVMGAGVALTGLNFYGGDLPGGDRGVLSLPELKNAFRENVEVAVMIGRQLGCRLFNALYGLRQEGIEPQVQDQHAYEQLSYAAMAVNEGGGQILIEPLSGSSAYPLRSVDDAASVIRQVDSVIPPDSVRVLADIYHLAANGEDVVGSLTKHASLIGHVQVADHPGRHEPGTGQIDFGEVFRTLELIEYEGWIGLEYIPSGEGAGTFLWINGDVWKSTSHGESRLGGDES